MMTRAPRLSGRFCRQPLAVAAAVVAGMIVLVSLAAPLLPLPDPAATNLSGRLALPGAEGHLLGTDLLGRDILARLVWGTRTSLAVGFGATLVAATAGTLLGLVAAYVRGSTDWLLMRAVDVLMAFPYLLLALAIVAVLGPGLGNALAAIAIVNIPFFARTVRGATLAVSQQGFVDASRVNGRGPMGILFGHILPHVLPIIVVTMTTTMGWMILETAGLSFLGLGAQPPQADLGSMLGDGRLLLLVKPHLALLPGVVIFVLVVSFNLVGDGLRDALDPRLTLGSGGRR